MLRVTLKCTDGVVSVSQYRIGFEQLPGDYELRIKMLSGPGRSVFCVSGLKY